MVFDPEKPLLKKWGFKSRKDYEDFIGGRLRDLDVPAQELKLSFDRAVERWTEECLVGQGDQTGPSSPHPG